MVQATIYYLDGRQLVGSVSAWKPNSGHIELREMEGGQLVKPQWPLVAHIDRPVHASRLGKSHEFQNYVVDLVNGQSLSGVMVSAVVTPNGVEVWHASDDVHLVERFIPWQAIKTYKLGHVPLQSIPVSDEADDSLSISGDSKEGSLTSQDDSHLSLGLMEVSDSKELTNALDRSKLIDQTGFDRTLKKTIGDILVQGFYPITADMPKKRLNFSKGECWSIRLNVRFATQASQNLLNKSGHRHERLSLTLCMTYWFTEINDHCCKTLLIELSAAYNP